MEFAYAYRNYVEAGVMKAHLERHLKSHEIQDKIEERLENDFNRISQSQQQGHNPTVNLQDTEVNVNAQEISGELDIQETLETSMTLVPDNKDPAYDFDELAYDVIWIDSENFSTINATDWNLLGDEKK
ncbi:unnamed protein product [Orchesella dallaii]|uniref:Uncharacterized protein n=1 Tax=Orchesella dallaii TaxID=48710 RepID=A0ABP1S2N6_9HEXA